jgi:DNA-binding response OmpR family regulator
VRPPVAGPGAFGGQRQVLVDGRRVDLTPKEFEVVHYLRERTGDTVSRLELLGAIWGYEDELGSNVVDAVTHACARSSAPTPA